MTRIFPQKLFLPYLITLFGISMNLAANAICNQDEFEDKIQSGPSLPLNNLTRDEISERLESLRKEQKGEQELNNKLAANGLGSRITVEDPDGIRSIRYRVLSPGSAAYESDKRLKEIANEIIRLEKFLADMTDKKP